MVSQCALVGVARGSYYYRSAPEDSLNIELMERIDALYTDFPFYGSRRMTVELKRLGYSVNRKRIRRLMAEMGLEAIYPKPNTSQSHPEHKVYPYLLKGLAIEQPNQVWSTDITYVRLAQGFAYLVAVIDWYSRKVLGWRLSNTMDTGFCLDCLEVALQQGQPEVFNTDQGSQFTSREFTGRLADAGIRISMDGRGRALDNVFVERLWRSVKYENIYVKGYETMTEAKAGLAEYFQFYNETRPHQSLDYATPHEVHVGSKP